MLPAEEGPQPDEVFSTVRVSVAKVAIKSAYDRYMSVSTSGELVGRMEAIGPREQWEPVFEEVCLHSVYMWSLFCMGTTL